MGHYDGCYEAEQAELDKKNATRLKELKKSVKKKLDLLKHKDIYFISLIIKELESIKKVVKIIKEI